MIYGNDIELKVKNIFDEKQANARFQIAARREKIYTEIPEIKEIEETISREGVKLAIASAKGTEYIPETDLDELADRRDRIMVENGYSPDYIYDVYECEKCNDTGYMGGRMCDCMKKELQKQSLANSNIAPVLLDTDLKDFDIGYYSDVPDVNGNIPRKQAVYILSKCERFIEEFENPETKNLFFFGNTGLGKTFLSAAIAKKIFEKGYTVLYYSAKQLLAMMTDYDFGRIPEKKQAYENVFDADLLIIDDLGSEQQTSFSIASFFDVLNTRMLNGKKMIINTNLSAKDLHTIYSDRIYSRINEFETLKFIGEDIRLLKNN